MGKKMFAMLIVAVVAMFAGYNVYQSQNTVVLSELALANVEALAGCESSVQTLFGGPAKLTCTNSSGQSYTIDACDFDLSYDTECTGKQAND